MLRSLARRLRLPALAALALGLLAFPAQAATVVGGGFDRTMANNYVPPSRDTLRERTWLGFVTATVSDGGPPSNGSATVSGAATLVDRTGAPVGVVDATSPTGVTELYTFSFPTTGGTYDEYSGVGSVQLGGTASFSVLPGLGELPRTIENPTLTLDGNSGTLTASGQRSRVAYGPEAIFTFNLTSSLVTLKADGTRVISAIARATHNATFFGSRGYFPGPETFGLRLKLKADEVRGPQGPAGPAGPEGKAGKTVVLQTSLLRKAPFADGGKRHAIALLSTKAKQVLARGAVRARTIRVQLADGQTKRLRGVFLLKVGEQPAKRVRVL